MPVHDLGPIVSVSIYRRDAVIHRAGLQGGPPPDLPARGSITYLSRKSRERLAFIANNTLVEFRSMATLTYPADFPTDGERVKEHLHAWLMWARRQWRGLSYLWFLEFQKRGAPHIHLLLSVDLPRKRCTVEALYARVALAWARIVDSGDPRHLKAGTRLERIRKPDGAARYALKYAYKCHQKVVPKQYQNVGRFWGCSRDVTPPDPEPVPMNEFEVRAILADWRYRPDEQTRVWQTLYGVAGLFREREQHIERTPLPDLRLPT